MDPLKLHSIHKGKRPYLSLFGKEKCGKIFFLQRVYISGCIVKAMSSCCFVCVTSSKIFQSYKPKTRITSHILPPKASYIQTMSFFICIIWICVISDIIVSRQLSVTVSSKHKLLFCLTGTLRVPERLNQKSLWTRDITLYTFSIETWGKEGNTAAVTTAAPLHMGAHVLYVYMAVSADASQQEGAEFDPVEFEPVQLHKLHLAVTNTPKGIMSVCWT